MFGCTEQVFEFEYNNVTYYYNKVRKAESIRVEQDKDGKDKFIGRFTCGRCGGQGQSTWRPHNGICYECKGLGYYTNILNTTKNKETAERRIAANIAKKEAQRTEAQNKLLADNLQKTTSMYGDKFHVILDTKEFSTYGSREYLKSKGARWNPDWQCWWTKHTDTVDEDFKDFQTYEIPVSMVLNEYNRIDNFRLRGTVLKYLDWLEAQKGKVIV